MGQHPMKPPLLPFILPLVLLAGCGGHHDDSSCVQAITAVPNATYAGGYAGTYSPPGGAVGGSLDFTLTVATDGTVTGSAHNPATPPGTDATVTGTAGDHAGCGGETEIDLTYVYPDGGGGTLTAYQAQRSTLAGTYHFVSGGKLVVAAAG